MPIEGVSDIRRLPRIGKVRLGIKEVSKKTGNEFPRAVDHWVVNEDDSTPAWAAEAFRRVYGDKPKVLNIMLPVSNRDLIFDQWYKCYGSGTGKVCQGNGITATRVDPGTGEMIEVTCNPDECPKYAAKHCRRVASLRFLLPDVPGLGAWQWDSTSFHSIVNINSGLDFVQAVAGRIHMIPLQLEVRPMEVQVEGKKKVVFVGSINCNQVRLVDIQRLAQVPENQVFLLDAPRDSNPPDDLFPQSLVQTYDEPTTVEPEIIDPEPEEAGTDPLDEEINRLFDAAKAFPAKRMAMIQAFVGRKNELVDLLRQEAAQHTGGPASSQTESQAKPAGRSRSNPSAAKPGVQQSGPAPVIQMPPPAAPAPQAATGGRKFF